MKQGKTRAGDHILEYLSVCWSVDRVCGRPLRLVGHRAAAAATAAAAAADDRLQAGLRTCGATGRGPLPRSRRGRAVAAAAAAAAAAACKRLRLRCHTICLDFFSSLSTPMFPSSISRLSGSPLSGGAATAAASPSTQVRIAGTYLAAISAADKLAELRKFIEKERDAKTRH